MGYFQLSEFLLRFNLAAFYTATWIGVVLTLVGFVFILGLFWGKAWNKEWSLGGHRGSLTLILLLFGPLAAYAVFNLRTISQLDTWFTANRTSLARSVADSGRFNRDVLFNTWQELAPTGSQAQLNPPDQGGNELRLNNPEEAFTLAFNAAQETHAVLSSKSPFVFGVPLATKSPRDIATETVDAIRFDASRFPTVVPAANEWSTTAATIQANYALDTALSALKPGMEDLRIACLWLLVASFFLAVVIIPINAVSDIKVNPTPER